jgi:hypothetical protein
VIDVYENIPKDQLIEENIHLKATVVLLKSELEQIKRMIFGSKSERFISNEHPSQLSLLDVAPKQPQEKPTVKNSCTRAKK